jgi:methyl-accepting chemotaxis protein
MKFGIKQKLIASFLGASILPLAGVSFYAYWKSQDALRQASMEQVESMRLSTESQLKRYFQTVQHQISFLSHDAEVVDALAQFNAGFKTYSKESGLSIVDQLGGKKRLADYYKNEFAAEFAKQNPDKSAGENSVLARRPEDAVVLQTAYIADNANPLGSKHKLDVADGNSTYNRAHARYHGKIREYLEKFEYYDIFLIDAESGNIVYSVYKELDFATNLKTGPYANTSLAKAFSEATKLSEGEDVYMADFATYYPSFDAPASFIAKPIYQDGELKGVIAFQLSIDAINKITLQKYTKFDSLESFLVGSDYKMRSDVLGDKENRNVKSSFKNPEKGSIKNDHIDWALKGEKHLLNGKDYIGRDVVAAFGPFDVFGNRWVLKTVVTEEEAFAAVSQMRWALLLGALLAAGIVGSLALWFARSLANRLISLAEGMRSGAGTVAQTSQQIADVSSRLSEASTEQAASLQETVASIDEISAMVQRNADSATNSSKASDASTQAAQRGKEKVEQMMGSINDIAKGNEDIMSSIQKSNQEISEIVHVIQAIADKTKVINDIVFQTKLLSFNASVEAARAGEHGKGFAVVAEEVGNLASMSGKAATEISDMLDKSVHRVTQIVEGTRGMMDGLVRSSKDKVEFGTRTARECAGSLDEIMRNVSSVSEMVREISTASREQSTGVREITKAMSELDQVTQANTASSNDASHTARELQAQAERLNGFVKELAELVYGQGEQVEARQPSNSNHGGPSQKVVTLDSYRSPKKDQAHKKVVGLEFDAPSANDNRFEDA